MKRILCLVLCVLVSLPAGTGIMAATAKKVSPKNASQNKSMNQQDSSVIHDCASCHTFTKDEAGFFLKDFGEVIDVKLAPVKGLYEITLRMNDREAVAYLDFGKNFLVPGPVFDIATRRPITPPPKNVPRRLTIEQMDKIPVENSIVMGNPQGKKRIFVFTDSDCPFCAKLHGELKKVIEKEPELAIYIKMYPLKMHPKANDHARVILGAGSNSLELLEKAFAGQLLPKPENNDPEQPVKETVLLAESLGIHSTPTLIFPDGTVAVGALDAATLRIMLEKNL